MLGCLIEPGCSITLFIYGWDDMCQIMVYITLVLLLLCKILSELNDENNVIRNGESGS